MSAARVIRAGRIVAPDRILAGGALAIDGDCIAELLPAGSPAVAGACDDYPDAIIVPGFVDVHVHGVEGLDSLDPSAPLAEIASRLARFGTTAFCPTTVACDPASLRRLFTAIDRARQTVPRGARVLPAHLESNFISPEYRGAQPLGCLRLPPSPASSRSRSATDAAQVVDGQEDRGQPAISPDEPPYSGEDVLAAIDAHAGCTGIVTLAPELPEALDLVRALGARGIRVSVGHSGATYEQARAGFEAGARHATHLFNRMSPLHHRDPGVVGAVLERPDVEAELICDGYHVHPSAARLALQVKTATGVLAITDGTGGSGLPVGSTARLGGRRITVRETAAFLDDGTLAGSTLTMDRAFRTAVNAFGCSLADAARLCATNPARALGLSRQGQLAAGSLADFVILGRDLEVRETWVAGTCVHRARP